MKLIANATSYGVLVEVVVDERATEVPCMVYHGGEVSKRVARKTGLTQDEFSSGSKVEKPGKYFAPYGGLIPAAGRLLLAIAETLFRERGISYCFCDTDSLCPARPTHMSREEFRKRVLEVAGPDGWFQALSPYSDRDPIFALEDVNYRLLDGSSGETGSMLEPLYCLAISAKRYVLFNIVNVETIIRKIAGHGLGALRHMDDYVPSAHPLTAPEHIAAPVDEETAREARRLEAAFTAGVAGVTAENVRAAQRGVRNYGALVHGSTPRMLCDIWRIVVDCFRNGTQDKIDDIISALPQLDTPQYTQLTLSSSHLMELYPNLPNRRGFQFFATFPAPKCRVESKYVRGAPFDEHKALCGTTLYASVPPEGVTSKLIEQWKTTGDGLFRRDNNEFLHGLFDPAWQLKLQTVADKLRGYFYHGEIESSGGVGDSGARLSCPLISIS